MSFLGRPCICGWALDELNEEETLVGCARCGIKYSKQNGYWSAIEIDDKTGSDKEIESEMLKRKHLDGKDFLPALKDIK